MTASEAERVVLEAAEDWATVRQDLLGDRPETLRLLAAVNELWRARRVNTNP